MGRLFAANLVVSNVCEIHGRNENGNNGYTIMT